MSRDVTVTWLGHATFLLGTPEGKAVLVDPWLKGNPKCPREFHEATCDAILITHGHGDHTGDAVEAAGRCRGRVVAMVELAMHFSGHGIAESKLVAMNKGGTVELSEAGITVSMTDARHSSSVVGRDGTAIYAGEPAGFVVKFSDGTTLYVAGDTCLFGDMELIRLLYQPSVAILPIGDFYTMDPRAAAHACRLLGVGAVIPCHYGTFPALTGTPARLREECQALGLSVKVTELSPGEGTKI
jgi:L-ascorbate metabolism protein UlaG (beta-lactamase superfamily)